MKKYVVKKFTLIELLAAMAVFSIMLMISIRIFSGSQQIWLRSEQKTDTFASARTAMEYMASRIQSLTYFEDPSPDKQYPFEITEKSIWFVSTMAMADGNSRSRFLKFRLVDPAGSSEYAGFLQMIKYEGHNGKWFGQLFPTYYDSKRESKYIEYNEEHERFEDVKAKRKITSYTEAKEHLRKVFNKFDASDFKDNPRVDGVDTNAVAVDICENVVGLNFRYYVAKGVSEDSDEADKLIGNNANEGRTATTHAAPYLVEIELKILDSRDSFLKWKEADSNTKREEIFLEHGYTFSRAVLLGKKGNE